MIKNFSQRGNKSQTENTSQELEIQSKILRLDRLWLIYLRPKVFHFLYLISSGNFGNTWK